MRGSLLGVSGLVAGTSGVLVRVGVSELAHGVWLVITRRLSAFLRSTLRYTGAPSAHGSRVIVIGTSSLGWSAVSRAAPVP